MLIKELTNIIVSLLIPILIGYLPLRSLFRGKLPFNQPVSIALSFGLGFGILTQLLFFIIIFVPPLSLLKVQGGIIIFCVIMITINKLQAKESLPKLPKCWSLSKTDDDNRHNPLKKLMALTVFAFITFEFYFCFYVSLMLPMVMWDEVYAIAVKSKYFLYGGAIEGLSGFSGTASYPLHVELAMTWVTLNLGHWNPQLAKIIFPAYLIGYLVIQYYFIASYTNRWWALMATGLLLSSNFLLVHATLAYRPIVFLYYNIIPILLILAAHQHKNSRYLILAGLFAAIASFTKLEGIGHLLIYTALILFLLKKSGEVSVKKFATQIFQISFLSVIIFLFFTAVKCLHHISPMEGRLGVDKTIDYWMRIKTISSSLSYNLFVSGNWNILWAILLISFITGWKKLRASLPIQFITLALGLYFLLYILVGLFTSTFHGLFGAGAYANLARTILHFFPLCIILIVLINSNSWANERTSED